MAATNVGLDWLEFSCSADAQQLSACVWLRARCDPELCESPLCIGHALSKQQDIRASGVGAHPAQTAALPAEIRTASASANNCLARVNTSLGCRTKRQVSNRFQASRSSGASRRMRIPRCGDSEIGSRNGPNGTENRLERLAVVEFYSVPHVAFAYIVALLASPGVAIVVTPALAYAFLRGAKSILREHERWVARTFKRRGSPKTCLGHWITPDSRWRSRACSWWPLWRR